MKCPRCNNRREKDKMVRLVLSDRGGFSVIRTKPTGFISTGKGVAIPCHICGGAGFVKRRR